MNNFLKQLAIALILLPLVLNAKDDLRFKIKQIKVGQQKIKVEIAETEEQHQRGLMFRKKLGGPSEGMLFIFQNEEVRRFWMKNTFIDLDIGYFSADKSLIDVQQMTAVISEMEYSPPSYTSLGPAQYALEMPKGWFKAHKIVIGNKLVLD
jgi:uncharacterized membrane protein (UPF0127 family)